jgi:hypothetical protein
METVSLTPTPHYKVEEVFPLLTEQGIGWAPESVWQFTRLVPKQWEKSHVSKHCATGAAGVKSRALIMLDDARHLLLIRLIHIYIKS